MDFAEREYLINKIIAGCTACEYDGEPVLVYEPSPLFKVKGHAIYLKAYRHAELLEVSNEEQIIDEMKLKGLWTDAKQRDLDAIPDKIESLKVELYNSYFQGRRREAIKKSLDNLRFQEVELMQEREQFKHLTCEGYASACKSKFLICSATVDLYGKPFFPLSYEEYPDAKLDAFVRDYMENKVDDQSLRYLSQEEPWRSIWSSGKSESSIFGNPSSLLTQEQRMLIIWSKIYESIHESPECPPKEILEDEDCLDGWLIVQGRKRDDDKKKSHGLSANDKFAKNDEVFIIAETPEDAARVNAMNSQEAIFRKQQRMSAITKAGGIIKEQHMPDSQMAIKEIATQQFRQQLKRGK